jgi:hypothetical protein
MRLGLRLRWLLVVWISVTTVAGVTYVVADAVESWRGEQDGNTVDAAAASTDDSVLSAPSLARGQSRVTGTVRSLHVQQAVLDPATLSLPITIEAERGSGNAATITGATRDGQPVEIVWDAGRPLRLSGDGGLILDPVTLDLTDAGVRVGLGGTVCGLEPGAYTLEAPVAVGAGGVAETRDEVTFDATAGTTVSFSGTPWVLLPLDAVVASGPGSVELAGDLVVERRDGRQQATEVALVDGPFELRIESDGTVEATLQGPLRIS